MIDKKLEGVMMFISDLNGILYGCRSLLYVFSQIGALQAFSVIYNFGF